MHHLSLDWHRLHALVVHFPIVLLLIAPALVIAGMGLSGTRKRIFFGLALAIMAVGTAMTFVAVATGEAAVKAVGPAPAFEIALAVHRTLAETTRELFLGLTLGFAGLLLAPRLLRRELDSHINTALLAIYLVFYATGALFLIHTSLQGRRLASELDATAATTYQLSRKWGAR